MYKYSFNYDKESMAKALGRNLPISTKHSVEICSLIRGMNLTKGKELLKEAINKRKAVPFRRYNMSVGHKKGVGPGRYPIKASKEILKTLETVENNAVSNELNKDKLVIIHINAQRASSPWHFGRKRRRKMKRTHIEVIVKEAGKESRK